MEELLLAEGEASEDKVAAEEVNALVVSDGEFDVPIPCMYMRKWAGLNCFLAKAKLRLQTY